MLTATLGAQCMLWQTSPAATELETRTLDWLRQLIGLPKGFVGVIQDTASSATLCALLVARERATGWRADAEGLGACPPLAFYASEEAHSSVEKAVRIAGLGRQNLRPIPTDHDFAMRPDALAAAIRAGRAAGRVPAGGVATLGATGVGASDRRRPSGAICREAGGHPPVRADGRGRARRQLRVQPAQVAAHQLRLLGPLRARPGRPGAHVVGTAGVSAIARDRRGDRLPRLGRAARPALSRAQAVVRPAQL